MIGDDTDLLLVAVSQEEDERTAERPGEAQVGDAVLAIASERWHAMARSPSPHWQAIRAPAIRLQPKS